MAHNRLMKAQKALTIAVREMEAALIANPLLADPLMAAAQVLEDLSQIIVDETGGPKRRRKKRLTPAQGKARGKPRRYGKASSRKRTAAASKGPRL